METQKISDVEVDRENMKEIELYLNEVQEFAARGVWKGFMGCEHDAPPPEPRLLSYSWEA